MDEIRDKTFRNQTVRLDGTLFINCSFEDCLLQYGGGRCEWESTRFSNCRVILDGQANHTVQVRPGPSRASASKSCHPTPTLAST